MNLVVKNVDETTTEEEFEEFFSQFGSVKNVKMVAANQTGFVSFNDRESARLAKEKVPNILFKNRYLFVNFCEPREQRHLAIEEKKDRSAFAKSRREAVKSQNSDVLDLITCLSYFMSQVQGGGAMNQSSGGNKYYNNMRNGAPQ